MIRNVTQICLRSTELLLLWKCLRFLRHSVQRDKTSYQLLHRAEQSDVQQPWHITALQNLQFVAVFYMQSSDTRLSVALASNFQSLSVDVIYHEFCLLAIAVSAVLFFISFSSLYYTLHVKLCTVCLTLLWAMTEQLHHGNTNVTSNSKYKLRQASSIVPPVYQICEYLVQSPTLSTNSLTLNYSNSITETSVSQSVSQSINQLLVW